MVCVGTYSAWESTATLCLLGGARGVWAPTGEERGGVYRVATRTDCFIMSRPNRRGIKRYFCLTYVCLSVCLSRTSNLSRERRGLGSPKIGTEVAHVTRDSDTTFKVKRSKVKVTRPIYSARP